MFQINTGNLLKNYPLCGFNYSTVYICFSSILFLIPGVYGILTKQYTHGFLSVITSFVSVVYWIKPISGWRLTVDKSLARLSFIYYMSTGVYCSKSVYQYEVMLAVPLTAGIIGAYLLSCILFENKNENWVYFHVLFHLCSSIGKLNTLFVLRDCICNAK